MADVAGPSTSTEAEPSSSKMATPADKRSERLKKLRELHTKRVSHRFPSSLTNRLLNYFLLTNLVLIHQTQSEGSRLNHIEVVEEHKRQQMPKTWMKKKEIAEKKLNEEEERQALGKEYERTKFLDIQADDALRWQKKQDKKKNTDTGFSSFEAATARQYDRLTKSLQPDMDHYKRLKEEVGEEVFYAGRDTVIQGAVPKDDPEKVDKMVQDLEKQMEKRSKYSRRRAYDADADVDFINERNSKFNKKLERFYGKYTQNIKDNLERGTAL